MWINVCCFLTKPESSYVQPKLHSIVYTKNQVRGNKKQTPFVNTWKHSQACSWETEKPLGYLVNTPRSSQDNKKQRKRIKQEHQKSGTKVHQYWFNRCPNL